MLHLWVHPTVPQGEHALKCLAHREEGSINFQLSVSPLNYKLWKKDTAFLLYVDFKQTFPEKVEVSTVCLCTLQCKNRLH